jgi:protein-S-isoprenylcysteine O-methyltransferase Ste14
MNNNDYVRMYKYVPASTLGASIITAVVLHYLFPMTILIPFPYNLLGLPIVGFAVYLVLQSVRLLLSRNTTVEVDRNPSWLVTQCPYNYSRNPIYLGLLLIALGATITLSSLSSFIAPLIFFLVVNTIIIPFEENRLEKNLASIMKGTKNQLGDGYRLKAILLMLQLKACYPLSVMIAFT